MSIPVSEEAVIQQVAHNLQSLISPEMHHFMKTAEATDDDREFIGQKLRLAQLAAGSASTLDPAYVTAAFFKIIQGLCARFAERHEPLPHFYMIQDEAGNVRGFLLGTVHCLDKSVMQLLDKKVQKMIRKTERIFLEISEPDRLKACELDRLGKYLSTKSSDELLEAVKKYKTILKPRWATLASSLSEEAFEKQLSELSPIEALKMCIDRYLHVSTHLQDTSGVSSIDEMLYNRFREAGKPIHGLESFEMHRQVLEKIDARTLPAALDPSPFCAFSFASIWKLDRPSDEDYSTEELRLQDGDRNRSFCTTIHGDLTTQKTRALYAMGTAHLRTVINYLEARNFSITKCV